MRIKTTQVETVRVAIMKAQGGKCPLCLRAFSARVRPALDHDHKTGFIRGVLCINCNGMEGKIFNRAVRGATSKGDPLKWLQRMVDYLETHRIPQWSNDTRPGLIHPTHKTEAEKRTDKLSKARRRYHAKKARS